MTLKNPALLKTKKGASFLDYWFFKTGRDGEYKECSGDKFVIKINTINGRPDGVPMSGYNFFPKTNKGLWGVVDEFGSSEGLLYQVGLRDLAQYVCKNDTHAKIKIDELPVILARNWKNYLEELVK